MHSVKSLKDKSAGLYTRPKPSTYALAKNPSTYALAKNPSTIIILYRYSICIR